MLLKSHRDRLNQYRSQGCDERTPIELPYNVNGVITDRTSAKLEKLGLIRFVGRYRIVLTGKAMIELDDQEYRQRQKVRKANQMRAQKQQTSDRDAFLKAMRDDDERDEQRRRAEDARAEQAKRDEEERQRRADEKQRLEEGWW